MIGQNNGIQEQLARIYRYRKSLNDYSVDQKAYEDNIWSFYQSTHHLKDWIGNCYPALKSDVEIYINNSQYLKLAADLANRSKHMSLTKPRGGSPDINRNDVRVGITTISLNLSQGAIPAPSTAHFKPSVHWEYYVDTPAGTTFKNIDLADLVISEWEQFINANGI